MSTRNLTCVLGARLDESVDEAEHALGTTVIIQGSGDSQNFNRIAVYVEARDILSASANATIDASAGASASAGGYVALASANSGQFLWVRSSGPIA